jgi:hypothetical protein
MARYFARVELHNGDSDDYETLRTKLKVKGFSNCIAIKSGGSKKLPTGFYVATLGEFVVSKVAKTVKDAADSTGLGNEVVVVKSEGSFSYLSEECD